MNVTNWSRMLNYVLLEFLLFVFSSKRGNTNSSTVSWARRCVLGTAPRPHLQDSLNVPTPPPTVPFQGHHAPPTVLSQRPHAPTYRTVSRTPLPTIRPFPSPSRCTLPYRTKYVNSNPATHTTNLPHSIIVRASSLHLTFHTQFHLSTLH